MPEMPVGDLIADLLSESDILRRTAESSLKEFSAEVVLPEMCALLHSPDKRIRNRGDGTLLLHRQCCRPFSCTVA